MVAGFSAAEWAALLDPFFALAGPLGTPEGSLPTALLEPFFEAKGQDDLAEALAGPDAYTADALRARLDRALPPPATLAARAVVEPEPVPAAPEPDGPRPVPVALPPEPPARDVYEPLPELDEDGPDDGPFEAEVDILPATSLGWQTDAPVLSSWPDGPAAPPPAEPPAAEDPVLRPPWFSSGPALSPIGPPDDEAEADASPPEDVGPVEPGPAPSSDDDEPLWQRMMSAQDASFEDVDEGDPDEDPEDEPLWKRFVAPSVADAAPAPPRSARTVPDRADVPEPGRAEPTGALDQIEARVLGSGTDDSRRAWFVAELFGGSEPDYRDTLALLAQAETWTEATQIIARDVFRKHRVNIYSEPAVVFTDAVESRFSR
ncbi:MAG TPA: hypothetical protein VF576_00175 [Rubricoccaceae bacterium]